MVLHLDELRSYSTTMPLTDQQIRRTRSADTDLWLSDGNGLRLLITPAGGRYWRLKYRYDGRQKTLSLGVFPKVAVAAARVGAEEARALLANGIDPSAVRRRQKAGSLEPTAKPGVAAEGVSEVALKGSRVSRAVFTAVLELISDPRAGRLSMEAVAERSGVHKTTLYRRWQTFPQLLKAAIAEVDITAPELVDTGSLQGDLLNLARQFAGLYARPDFVAVNRIVAGNQDPDLQHLIDEYWTDRASLFTVILERAARRGEPVQPDRLAMAIEVIVGPMLVRTLMRKQAIDEALIVELARLAGATLGGS
jgi:AcrR family transcriptional regulator